MDRPLRTPPAARIGMLQASPIARGGAIECRGSIAHASFAAVDRCRFPIRARRPRGCSDCSADVVAIALLHRSAPSRSEHFLCGRGARLYAARSATASRVPGRQGARRAPPVPFGPAPLPIRDGLSLSRGVRPRPWLCAGARRYRGGALLLEMLGAVCSRVSRLPRRPRGSGPTRRTQTDLHE